MSVQQQSAKETKLIAALKQHYERYHADDLSEKTYPCDVTARPVEASDETERHRVTAYPKDDWNGRGRLLGYARRIFDGYL